MLAFLSLILLALSSSPSLLVSAGTGLKDGRTHGNMAPRAPMPLVRLPDTKNVVSRNGTQLPPYDTTYYFDQLIDHNNPGLGTFKQRYWHTWEFYEPGGPIVISTPGEANAEGYEGYLTNKTINGQIAQQQNGSTVVIEHRFFGASNPYNNLSVASYAVHTIQQAIDDLEYFAKNVKLPQPNGDQVTPDKAPWILIGGSYSGALTSWTMVDKPGVFFAGYASSAVVQSITAFWQYFDPIRQFMPKNCSSDVQKVIAHVDNTFTFGSQSEIQAIKDNFGLGAMTHLDDVAGALRNNLWEWQEMDVTSGPGAPFFQFCDALEMKDGKAAGPGGWGLDHALTAWGSYWNASYFRDVCGDQDAEDCLGTYNSSQPFWTDIDIDNAGRSWTWFVCNELGFFQDGAPPGMPSIVSRLIQPAYDERQCTYWFPEKFSQRTPPNALRTNVKYDGWFATAPRVFYANGQRDPWRDATVSSDFFWRESNYLQPIGVGEGYHCSDLITSSGTANPSILAVQQKALASMKSWLSNYKPGRKFHARDDASDKDSVQNNDKFVKPVNAWLRGIRVVD